MEKQTRLAYLDYLKSFLIVLVVVGHVIQLNFKDFDSNLLFRYIYSFHMPLFMFVSGFLCYKTQLKISSLPHKLEHLYIPFFSWFVVSSLLFHPISDFPGLLKKVILNPDTGLWFLWVLGLCISLLFTVSQFTKQIHIDISIGLCIMLAGVLFFEMLTNCRILGIKMLSNQLPFFLLGFFCNRYQAIWDKYALPLTGISLALFLFLAFFWFRKDDIVIFHLTLPGHSLAAFVYRSITAICASLGIWGTFRLCFFKVQLFSPQNKVGSFFSLLGASTLIIYASHMIFLRTISSYVDFSKYSCIKVFVVSVVVLGLSFLLNQILLKTSITRMIFIGQFQKRQ